MSKILNLFTNVGEMLISDLSCSYDANGRNYSIKVNEECLDLNKVSNGKVLSFAMRNADIANNGENKFISTSMKALLTINKIEGEDKVEILVKDIIKADFVEDVV